MYCSLYPDVLQLIPDRTAAYIIKVRKKLPQSSWAGVGTELGNCETYSFICKTLKAARLNLKLNFQNKLGNFHFQSNSRKLSWTSVALIWIKVQLVIRMSNWPEWNGMEFSCLGSRLLCLATDSLLHQGDPRPGYQNRLNTQASRRPWETGCNSSGSLFYSHCVCSTMCLLYFHRKKNDWFSY